MNEILELKEYLQMNIDRLTSILELSTNEDDKLFINYIYGKKDATYFFIKYLNEILEKNKNT